MHFSGPGKCIWALPRPRQCFRLLVCLQRQRKAFKTSLTEFMCTFAFRNSEAFLCFFRKMAAVSCFLLGAESRMHFSGLEKCIWARLCSFRYKAEILLTYTWVVMCFLYGNYTHYGNLTLET